MGTSGEESACQPGPRDCSVRRESDTRENGRCWTTVRHTWYCDDAKPVPERGWPRKTRGRHCGLLFRPPPSRLVLAYALRVSVFRLLISFLLPVLSSKSPFASCHSFTSLASARSPLFRFRIASYRLGSSSDCCCAAWSCYSNSLKSKWASVRPAMSHLGCLQDPFQLTVGLYRALWRRPRRWLVWDSCTRLSLAAQCRCA